MSEKRKKFVSKQNCPIFPICTIVQNFQPDFLPYRTDARLLGHDAQLINTHT